MKTNQPPYHKRLGLRRIVLAMTPEMHERIRECAFIDGRSMQKWIIRTLAKCLKMDVENEMKRL